MRLFNLNPFTIHFDLWIFLDFKHFFFTNLFAHPIGLLGVLQCDYPFTQVQSSLNVKILVLLGHASVVDDQLDAFVDVVRIFLSSAGNFYAGNLGGVVWLWLNILVFDFFLVLLGYVDLIFALVLLRLWLMLGYFLRSLAVSSEALLLLALRKWIPRLNILLLDLLVHNLNRGRWWLWRTDVALADAEAPTTLINVVVRKLIVTFYRCLYYKSQIFVYVFLVVWIAYSDTKV